VNEVESGEVFLAEIDRTTDTFTLTIRGHQGVDELLTLALTEVLGQEHNVEIGALRFPLRVELGVALGAFPPDLRRVLLELNRIRNRFAHERSATFEGADAAQLVASLPDGIAQHLQTQLDISTEAATAFATVIVLVYLTMQRAITSRRDAQVEIALALDVARRRIASGRAPMTARAEELLKESRGRRATEGRL